MSLEDWQHIDYDWLQSQINQMSYDKQKLIKSSRYNHHISNENIEQELRKKWDVGPHYTGKRVWAVCIDDYVYFFFGALVEIKYMLELIAK